MSFHELLDGMLTTVKAVNDRLSARIDVLERVPAPVRGEQGIPGRNADPAVVEALKEEMALLRKEAGILSAKIQEQTLVPLRGEKGDPGQDADPFEMLALKTECESLKIEVEFLRNNITRDLSAVISEEVTKAMALVPAPQDGRSVTVDELTPVIAAEVTKAMSAMPVPKDGIGLASALIDRDDVLVITATDGATKALGRVVGRDATQESIDQAVAARLATWPKPKDGRDGVDGLGFDDFEETYDGERTITRTYKSGDRVKSFTFTVPHMLDRGVYQVGTSYQKGDCVTWGGSLWIAQAETDAKPGDGATPWRLAVKAGREGKPGLNGKDGINGRDLTEKR